ncbi:MAG: histidine phosphotransferase family protein [Hyphomonadaceae bacterium]
MNSSKLAAYLASRICHDVASPLQALMNGCDLAFDDSMGGAMQAEGQKLLMEGVAKLNAKVQFMRLAVGSQILSEGQANPSEGQQKLAMLMAVGKGKLEWAVDAPLSNLQLRLLLNMALLMLEPVDKGGLLSVSAREIGDTVRFDVRSSGGSPNLRPEILQALSGQEPERGWSGGGIQPYYTRLLAEEAGFQLAPSKEDAVIVLTAAGPKAEF